MMGNTGLASPPFGGTDIDFKTGNPVVSYISRTMDFGRTSANITDGQGDLLFATNGQYIADRTGNQMMNGGGLNPGWYSDDCGDDGLQIFQAALILPKPGDSAIYYLFHNTADDMTTGTSGKLSLTTIDMRLNGDLGAVIAKNQPIVTDILAPGHITSVKHANGRDWWVFCHKACSNVFYRMLLTPDGLSAPVQQPIGIDVESIGQVVFSPDGSRFAFYDAYDGLQILEFDRCEGLLSNPVHFMVNDTAFSGGVAFSSDSKVLYAASYYHVFQYDVTAPNIQATQQIVAVYDGFIDPAGDPFFTTFNKMMLAPDGKIYIGTGNATQFLHVMHSPNVLGTGCNVDQHALQVTYYFNSLPNHPNYHLGALAGSPCDTLVSIVEGPMQPMPLQLYPNPNNGEFNLSFVPQPEPGELLIYDVLGKLVHQEQIAEWSQVKRVSLSQLPQGVYHSRLVWKGKTGVVRFVKE